MDKRKADHYEELHPDDLESAAEFVTDIEGDIDSFMHNRIGLESFAEALLSYAGDLQKIVARLPEAQR